MFLEHGIDGVPRVCMMKKRYFTIHNLAYQGWAQAEKFLSYTAPAILLRGRRWSFMGRSTV